MTKPPSETHSRIGLLIVLLVALGFVTHRVLIVLSAGDFLYPLEPSEAKNSQIAWDLLTGRFGEPGYRLFNYVANNGSIHHASYSSAALAYLATSTVFGHSLLAVRAVPLIATGTALLTWMLLVRRHFGSAAAVLAGLGVWFAPTLFIAFQLTFLGCHPESVLPLALAMAAWLHWCDGRTADPRASALLGVSFGYAAIFSYLLWPFLAFMAALAFVPPVPRVSRSAVLATVAGLLVGLWPLWIIVAAGGLETLLGSAITEREETTLTNTITGADVDWALWRQTFWTNMPFGFEDYGASPSNLSNSLGLNLQFEQVTYRGLVFGPLALLPWALTERNKTARRLALLVALAPTAVYAWLAFATPWKPYIPQRYFLPFAFLSFSAPGIAIGLALSRLRGAGWTRWLGIPLLGLAVWWLAFLAPSRLEEARVNVRLERAEGLLEHRYPAYYNLGMGTIWSEQVEDVNDLLDVLSAQGDPKAFQGVQAGLHGSGVRLALGQQTWTAPDLVWGLMRAGLNEWSERQSYVNDADRDDPSTVSFNVGWGAGIRGGWDIDRIQGVLQQGLKSGEWPPGLPLHDVWRGVGFGYGRAHDGEPPSLPPELHPSWAESFHLGFTAGRALGPVPEAPRKPIFDSVRGPAT